MIILDTNILHKGPDTVTTDLLKTIQAAGVERVGIPSIALEELVAQRVNPYRARYEGAVEAWAKIAVDTPWNLPQTLPKVDVRRYAHHWRRRYEQVGETLLADESILHEAMVREMNLLPPCKLVAADGDNKGHKIGARDAAIWLTATRYAEEHPDETVYFVSANTRDFGSGAPYPHPMRIDLGGVDEGRFVHLTNVNELVELFAKKATPDDDAVRAVLESPSTARLIGHEAFRYWKSSRFRQPLTSGRFEATALRNHEPAAVRGWSRRPRTTLNSIGDVKAHSIGPHVWCSVVADWTLIGPADFRASTPQLVSCNWETRILISTTQGDSEPSLLRSAPPQPATAEQLQAAPPWDLEMSPHTNDLGERYTRTTYRTYEENGDGERITYIVNVPDEDNRRYYSLEEEE
ncbi:PIN domain-containing protein [Streptomyces sp. NBC_00121]|uniref:PIN domain-containing protein n=1 Tax=unclassified Streptomyces TaxID=2593676 RepID=UPI0028C38180|nr:MULTISPECIES: PIN domain-containing protein [unclassified Streptomyces]WNO69455.1 PIN domain-containing protein [Streptomyces sp. AM2-3-1]WSC74234.1 PIN domain-containing protein [Streptomyces sp. NBC_01760]